MVEEIIKRNYIFNNIILISRPHIIKISPKLDMAIIWIDIWDVQSSKKVKELINRYFNIKSYITTVRGANINSSISECKNCWKWRHTMFLCRIQGAKCIKCNSLYKSKYHCHFTWYCKANEKSNPSRLETKNEESCPYSFKCSNCHSKHQANFNLYPFWKYCLNHKWYNKKQ